MAAGMFLVSNVMALGITPGRTTLNYEPGVEKEFNISVVNSERSDIDLVVLVQGDMNNSVHLSESAFKMRSVDEEKKISVRFDMPQELAPGNHKTEVIVVQAPKGPANSNEENTFFGATLGVVSEIVVLVPYPGKYLDIGVSVVGPNDDGEIKFVLPVINRGLENIGLARAVIEIFDSKNNKLATVDTNQLPVLSSEREELIAKWDASNASFGNYNMIANIYYDNESTNLERYFTIGEPLLELKEIKVNEFKLGGIAKFEMTVQNKWNENISTYSEMLVYNENGGVIADFKSSEVNVPALGKQTLVAYWDTAGIGKNTYDSSVALIYNQKSTEKKFKLEVGDNNINIVGVGYVISKTSALAEGNAFIVVLVVVIVVLIIINALWFLYFRKKLVRHSVHSGHYHSVHPVHSGHQGR
jgi:hypothetical protein